MLQNGILNPLPGTTGIEESSHLVVNYASLERPVGTSHGSLPDRIFTELKTAIRGGLLPPGVRLVEARLADDLGVSRNPVREALRRLAAEGMVTITARKGAVVAGLDAQKIREAIEVRALLEGHNARLAARRRDEAVLKRIRALLRDGGKAVAAGTVRELPRLNVRYHEETLAASSNELLREMLERLRERTAPLFAPGEPERQVDLWTDHAEILGAIVDGDESRAAELAADHVRHAVPGLDGLGEGQPPDKAAPPAAPPAARPARAQSGGPVPLPTTANGRRSR